MSPCHQYVIVTWLNNETWQCAWKVCLQSRIRFYLQKVCLQTRKACLQISTSEKCAWNFKHPCDHFKSTFQEHYLYCINLQECWFMEKFACKLKSVLANPGVEIHLYGLWDMQDLIRFMWTNANYYTHFFLYGQFYQNMSLRFQTG